MYSFSSLSDTEDLYTIAFQNIVAPYGKQYTFDLKMKMMGTQAHEGAAIVIKELNLPITTEEFLLASKKQYENIFSDTVVLPGKHKYY